MYLPVSDNESYWVDYRSRQGKRLVSYRQSDLPVGARVFAIGMLGCISLLLTAYVLLGLESWATWLVGVFALISFTGCTFAGSALYKRRRPNESEMIEKGLMSNVNSLAFRYLVVELKKFKLELRQIDRKHRHYSIYSKYIRAYLRRTREREVLLEIGGLEKAQIKEFQEFFTREARECAELIHTEVSFCDEGHAAIKEVGRRGIETLQADRENTLNQIAQARANQLIEEQKKPSD